METIPQSGNEPQTGFSGRRSNVPQEIPLKSATSYNNRPHSPDSLRRVKTDVQSSLNLDSSGPNTPITQFSADTASIKDNISEVNTPISQPRSVGFIMAYIEPFLGDTWFNYGLILFMVVITYFMTKLRLGLVTCLGLAYLVAQIYKLSWKSTYSKAKQDIKDTVNAPELDSDYEGALWVNQFLNRFWIEFENYLTKTIVDSVEPIITPYLPAFVPWVKFTTFTLGTKAPIIESIKGFRRIETDLVLMDAEISFTPYHKENLNEDRSNLKVVVTARIEFGGYHIDIPVFVDNVHLHAFARIKLRFMNDFPHIRMVETSLLTQPRYDYSVKLFSERFGYDLTHIPYLQTFIKKQVNNILGPMMLAPNKFILDLEAIMSGGIEANFPIGVLQVYIDSARGLKNTELIGVPDPFVSLNIEGRQEIGRTQVVWNNLNPTWGESFTILVHSLSETLNFKIMNQNVAKQTKMGTAEFNMSALISDPRQDLIAKVLRNSKAVGELSFRVNYFPTADITKNEDGTEQTIESDSAIVRFHLRQIEGMKKGGSIINLSKNQAQIVLEINGKIAHKSPFKTITGNMVFEDTYETFIESLKKANVKVTLRLSDRNILGKYTTSLSDLMESIANNKEWFKFEVPGSDKSIKVKLGVRLKPVIVDPNAIQGILPPIGFVRVEVIEAKGLKGGELVSKPEPYCQVVHSNKLVGKTRYLDNTTKPIWNDVYYVPVHGESDSLSFEVMHYNSVQKDKLLGKTSLPIKSLLGPKWGFKEGYQHGEPHQDWYPLHIKEDKEKGSIHLSLQYFSLHPQCLSDTKQVEKVLDQVKDIPGAEIKAQEPKEAHKAEYSPAEPSPLDSVKPEDLQKVHEEVENQFKLSDYNSGVLRIILHEAKGIGSVKSNLHAVVLLNNNERVPVHKTTSKRGSNPVFEDTCQTFIKEADIDRITVSIRSTKEGGQGKEPELAKWSGSVKEIIESLSDESRTFNFSGNTIGEVRLSFKFDACDYTVSPSESGRNMGILQVTVINAENLIAADRSGTSDPYVTFTLNGEKAFKTETHKKDLNPAYNESFTVRIEDRIKSKFSIEVFDWNQLGKHESLGSAQLDLSLLDVGAPFDVPVELENVKSGVVNLRMFFAPQYVLEDNEKHALPGLILDSSAQFATGLAKGGVKLAARSLTGGASLAMGTGKLAGNAIAGGGKLAIGGAKTVLSAPINVAKGGAGFVGSLFGKKNKDNSDSDRESRVSESSTRRSSIFSSRANAPVHQTDSHADTIYSETPTLANNNQPSNQPTLTVSPPQTSNGVGIPIEHQTSTNSNVSDDFSSPGSLRLSIFEAKELMVADSKNSHSDPYIKLYINRKNVYKTKVMKKTRNPQWNEVYTIPNYLISEPISVEFQIKSYARLGDRPDLGHYTLNTGQFISQTNTSKEFWTENGLGEGQSGRLHLKLEFIPHGVYLSPTLARNSSSNLSETSVSLHDTETSKSTKLFGKIKKGFGSIKN